MAGQLELAVLIKLQIQIWAGSAALRSYESQGYELSIILHCPNSDDSL